ncbi:BlaI/MecI/CopY family transcriptional regulator [uncultured Hymenobacter sp.]|uniref:BlaI/MecI/CopY family transcriptional regulator n=1 Tax=uncultured Hymenobacter sp. TaxID=170016 RepID=UPI0035CB1E6C
MPPPNPELTRAEEQVMQIIWQRGPSHVKDVRAALPAPAPALTTVSTIVRILEQKGFVSYEPVGRGYRYHALVAQDDYRRFSLRKLLRGHFGGSFGQLLSFFAQEENLDAAQLDALLRQAYTNRLADDDTPDAAVSPTSSPSNDPLP